MAFRKVLNTALIGTVGVTGWYIGTIQGRKNILESIGVSGNIPIDSKKSFPGLPIFATVSAASVIPYTEKTEVTNTTRIGQIMRHGFPGLDNVRSFDDYVLSYDRRNRVAHWVFEHLHKDNVKPNDSVDRLKCQFTADQSIHPYFR